MFRILFRRIGLCHAIMSVLLNVALSTSIPLIISLISARIGIDTLLFRPAGLLERRKKVSEINVLEKKRIQVVVATHKPYRMPDDPIYYPLHVGHAGKPDIGYPGDDTGDNISAHNATLCELTGVYWAWKNLDAEYVGLVHYRRHFTAKPLNLRFGSDPFDHVLTTQELDSILADYDMVLPKRRRYYIETLWDHYVHLPYTFENDLLTLQEVIGEKVPEYKGSFEKVMHRRSAHMFNMFIMKSEIFDKYCEWLFPILFETNQRIDTTGYSPMEARAVAYFGEFMIDVWNDKQQIRYKELPVMFMEKQNWLKKGGNFIKRKYIHAS